MNLENYLAELNSEQLAAATANQNVVAAAGAGSGKTKVLAARYAWLIIEQGYRVEEILTLTFTNKAVSEMYSRIYRLLAGRQDNRRAREALEDFHKAQICTLDSFCAAIARAASRRYGISPDFTSDNAGVRDLALDLALPFVLDRRENPALQALMADKKIRTVADELFAETMLRHSPISRPLDFSAFMRVQGEELLRTWNRETRQAALLVKTAAGELENITKTSTALYKELKQLLCAGDGTPAVPDIAPLLRYFFNGNAQGENEAHEHAQRQARDAISRYFSFLFRLKSVSLRGGNEFALIKETIQELRNSVYGALESIASAALGAEITASVFPLLDEFQRLFSRKKRESGMLTFTDIAHLAVDALSAYPDLRQAYKDAVKMVMIDEFQDNNRLQRDLIFLLAESPQRQEAGIPPIEELCPDKMFFVGDEKQSIYRFRGADVSVFRSLADSLARNSRAVSLSLRYNYRSSPALIAAFNRIFGGPGDSGRNTGGVFLPDAENTAPFEARYEPVMPSREISEAERNRPALRFCFLDEGGIPQGDSSYLSSAETEAAFIALTIRDMTARGELVQERNGNAVSARPCAYTDFAVLERSYAYQHFLEKQFKLFGVPFNAGRPAGLFNDAPINDLCSYLRVLLYPGDRLAYAALLRSPFARLSDAALAACMLCGSSAPFDAAAVPLIPPDEQERYLQCGERYERLRKDITTLPLTALVSRLWYDEGCRYETLWSESSQVYGELFDLFFEIARDMDDRGKSLVDFIDCLDALASREEKPDDMDIPSESGGGVRIMSIHKSKGLEFPVVFVYRCGGGGRNRVNTNAVYFHEKWGVTLNLPQPEAIPGNSGNYFFKAQEDEERQKETAELRRLLYVAMTRAESALFLTASLPKQTKDEAEDAPADDAASAADFIKTRLRQLAAKNEAKPVSSFVDLLLPALCAEGEQPFAFEVIPPYSRDELRRLGRRPGGAPLSMREAALGARAFYGQARIITTPPPVPRSIQASALRYPPGGEDAALETETAPDALNALLQKAGLDAAGFGTIAHACVEAKFTGRPALIPPGLLAVIDEGLLSQVKAEAAVMAEGFFNSALGALAAQPVRREAEFPFLTVTGNSITISGKMDLLFEAEGCIYVVDFKTDRVEAPERHAAQLAVYARAAGDIFGMPVRVWLFYLRSGRAVELTGMIGNVDIEALAAGYAGTV
jgi:ATP-dependent helicase/nuclease subunit A